MVGEGGEGVRITFDRIYLGKEVGQDSRESVEGEGNGRFAWFFRGSKKQIIEGQPFSFTLSRHYQISAPARTVICW